jgi:cytochrome P450
MVQFRFLPEGNAITVPPWVLHRDPRYFSPHPDTFIPERWLSDNGSGKYVTSRDAFIPFSFGPQNCVGRPLAQMEMRYVLATLMWNFDMEFDTPTYDPSSWERDMEDRFTLLKGSLRVRITQTGKRKDL